MSIWASLPPHEGDILGNIPGRSDMGSMDIAGPDDTGHQFVDVATSGMSDLIRVIARYDLESQHLPGGGSDAEVYLTAIECREFARRLIVAAEYLERQHDRQ